MRNTLEITISYPLVYCFNKFKCWFCIIIQCLNWYIFQSYFNFVTSLSTMIFRILHFFVNHFYLWRSDTIEGEGSLCLWEKEHQGLTHNWQNNTALIRGREYHLSFWQYTKKNMPSLVYKFSFVIPFAALVKTLKMHS